jgi:thiol-disulfide isomerase/thioredoxin
VGATVLTGLGVAATVLAVTGALGLWWRQRDGRLTPAPSRGHPPGHGPTPSEGSAPVDPALLSALGVAPGPASAAESGRPASAAESGGPVTLLQFSSAFCAPCRATRAVCAEIAGLLDGVQHVEVDAESHLDAVRALGIWRTPTVLILDGSGRVVRRATGVPAKAQVIAAVATLLPAAARS